MVDIKDLQARVKALATQREALIREVGSEERKLEEAYEKLRELGIEKPEDYDAEQLQEMATKMQQELEEKLVALEKQVVEGEQLAEKYKVLE